MVKKKKVRALLLFSGGLDSLLAAALLKEQGIEVVGITFKSYFFDENQAKKYAKQLGIPLKVVDISEEHFEIVKKPKYGYGRSMNPCIDCHVLMLKKAKEIMEKEGFDFIATGEVLGERPMSQNRKALKIVEKESGLEGYLLRPLSAKLLEPTIPEKLGLVDRIKLLAIKGRSRKKQIELAKKFGLKYPQPSGGCILTDLNFGKKLKEVLEKRKNLDANDIKLLRVGRHFWYECFKIVVGRNKEENEILKKLARDGDILIEFKKLRGPTTLVRKYCKKGRKKEAIEKAKELTKRYSKYKNAKEFLIKEI